MTATWAEFEAALARDLPNLETDDLFNFMFDGTSHGVMLSKEPDAVRALKPGNDIRPGQPIMTPDDEDRLRQAGWSPPPGPRDPFWAVTLPWPATLAEYRALAALLVTTMRDLMGVPGLDAVRYQAWNDRKRRALRLEHLALLAEDPGTPYSITELD